MKDSEKRLLGCIGWIDNELILEAEQTRFPGRRWGNWIALAACLALVAAIPLGLSRLPASSPGEAAATGQQKQQEPLGSEEAQEYPEASTEEETASDGVESPAWEPSYGDADILRTETLGGLYLGMPEQEILDLLQEPDATSNSGPVTYPDGSDHVTWVYYGQNLTLNLADTGDGWFLNEILMFDKGALSLSTGVTIGTEESAVIGAYPGAEVLDSESKVLEDGVWRTVSELQYVVGSRDSGLTIFLRDGLVNTITLGPWLLSPPAEAWEAGEEPEAEAYDLVSDAITVFTWNGDGCEVVTVTDRAAKMISTILTISEPLEPSQEKAGVSRWLDFGNGTAVELTGDDHATVWTYGADALDPNRTDGLTWHFSGIFQGLDQIVEEALADPNAAWD